MYILLTVLILIASALLILVVLVQNSKGGGLAANFASPNPTMGVRRTTDFLEKATWTLAASVLVISLLATMFMHTTESDAAAESAIKDQVQNTGGLPVAE